MSSKPCKHAPDFPTLQPYYSGSMNECVIDIYCGKCGACGSVTIEAKDIQWGETDEELFASMDVDACKKVGLHLKSCDNDGYCNFCGTQESIEEIKCSCSCGERSSNKNCAVHGEFSNPCPLHGSGRC